MKAIFRVMGINELKEVATSFEYLKIVLLNELMTLLEASRYEAYILELFLVENFCDASEHSLMVFFDVELPILRALQNGTVTKASAVQVFWHLLLCESHQAYVILVLAVYHQLSYLLL
jgi:hypothetical protein